MQLFILLNYDKIMHWTHPIYWKLHKAEIDIKLDKSCNNMDTVYIYIAARAF